ncbi:unnamed protein product [Ambrosiozyma monospora]|uniref:Unnamed protein product n=1 Tax=Ambrosiozyma monospora TaxID=43982 RepID=A0ACB5TC88_AMBMO|nr:unnamed protein product [Ambrosiozyma monospora]
MMDFTGAVLDEDNDIIIGSYRGDSEVVPDFTDPNAPKVKDKETLAKEAKLLEELKEKEELNEKLRQKQEQKQRLKDKKLEEQQLLFTNSKLLTDQIENLQNQQQQLAQTVMKNSVDHSDPAKVINVQDHDGFIDQPPEIDITKGDPMFQKFFTKFLQLLVDNRQKFLHPERTRIVAGKPIIPKVHAMDASNSYLTEEKILTLLDFEDDFLADLTEKHRNVVDAIPALPPANFYKGSGYTMVGGGIYSWYAYLAIQGLRRVGSVLPVEVLLPKEEDYEKELCETYLPSLNAKCIMMPTVFGKENMEKFELTGYQFKSFALLGSSFENTFLLDSDSFAVKNPDELFTSDLFLNLEMITWPDFWKRTTSPYYYQVAGIPIGKTPVRRMNDIFTDPSKFYKDSEIENYKQKIEFHDRSGAIPDWTSESGELLIRKSTHFDALLLSAYYNADGPQGYHALLSQGGAGEGDKETFIAASRFYNKPYYQVYRKPDRLYGYYKDKGKGEWDHTTIAQFDPLQDFAILKKVIKNIRTKIASEGDEFKYDYEELFRKPWNDNDRDLKPMFYHVHNPKMDPFYIQDQKITQDARGGMIRNIGGEFNRWLDFDFECWLYETMWRDLFTEKLQFGCFKEKRFGQIDGWLSKRIDYLRRSNTKILLGQEVKWNRFEPLEELSWEEDQQVTKEIWDRFFEDVPFSEVDDRGRIG